MDSLEIWETESWITRMLHIFVQHYSRRNEMKMDIRPGVYVDLTGIHAIGRSYKWDDRFVDLAQHVAQWSKDPSTKVGAVLVDKDRRVVSLGYNGAPRGTEEPDGSNREQKLMRTIHAEENALHFAERDVAGCTMYVSRPPCARCAAHMIQRGVDAVVYSYDGYDFDEYMSRWKESFDEAMKMFREAGVAVFAHKKIDTSGQVDAATSALASYEKVIDSMIENLTTRTHCGKSNTHLRTKYI